MTGNALSQLLVLFVCFGIMGIGFLTLVLVVLLIVQHQKAPKKDQATSVLNPPRSVSEVQTNLPAPTKPAMSPVKTEKSPAFQECSLAELRPELIDAIKVFIVSDEKPLLCYQWETRGTGLMLDPIGLAISLLSMAFPPTYTAYVLTPNRVIQASTDGNKSSFLLNDIVSVDHDRYQGVEVKGQGNTRMYFSFVSREQSEKFIKVLTGAIERAKSASTSKSQINSADRIRELTQLHKGGVISDVEFEQKRKEILGQL